MKRTKIAILLWVGSALGAIIWLSFFSGYRVFHRSMSQDLRDAVAVEAVPLPTKSVVVQIRPIEGSCVSVERARIDSDTFRVYVIRTCKGYYSSYWELHVNQKAPDGTIVDSYWSNAGPELLVGDKAEIRPDYFSHWDLNPRAVIVEVYATGRS